MRLLFTLFLASCAANVLADPITPQAAKSIASQYQKPGHNIELVRKAQRNKMHKVSAAVEQTSPYYIYSRGENQGYVIVAGDNCLPEILGYTDSGNFDVDNLPPTLQHMLEIWQDMVETAQVNETNIPLAATTPALTAARQDIAPLTTSHWHQTGPYNDLCPKRDDNGAKSMTGCVATAISQILYYWRKDLPSTLQETTPTYGMDGYSHASVTLSLPKGTPLKWDLMLDSYNNAPSEYNEAVATMVYAVGTASRLEYAIETGTATSGHIEDIPNAISKFFGMNGGWVAYRSSYSQEAWTQLIYDELAKGHPVMYTGVHPSNGGHAVYIDGYKKTNDLMHFNFGWGGQSDGYYTTTLETGMNGFNDYQSCLINAYPKKWNLKASIGLPSHAYANVDNKFRVTIENNSTLDFSGLYCFIGTNTSRPTALSNAKSSDEVTIIPKGGKAEVTLTGRPTSVKTWYVTITDANLNVLAQSPVEVEKGDVYISANKIVVPGSSESVENAGNVYTKIYSNKTIANAYVTNTSDVDFNGTARVNLYASADDGATWELEKTFNKNSCYVPANSETYLQFTLTNLVDGKLYYAEVEPEWGTTTLKTYVENVADSRTYFVATGSTDLTATLNDNVLSFTGHWDASSYISFVNRTLNKTAIAYDLTQVQGVGIVPDMDYPSTNALVLASGSATGTNVVVDNKMNGTAKVVAGYDLQPSVDISIQGAAEFDINQEPARWYLTTVPFDVDVPDGIIARQVNGHVASTLAINDKTENVSKLEAGKSYLIMTSSTHRQILSSASQDNILKKAPQQNPDEAFVGVYTATQSPEGAKMIKDKETDKQYFMNAQSAVIDAMRGYFYDEKMPGSTYEFRAYPNSTLDPAYLELAKRIQQLYDAKEKMQGTVTAEAMEIMADSIAHAEKIFSSQSITSATQVKTYYTSLEKWIADFEMMVENTGHIELDMSSLIANPSFEKSATAPTGWKQVTIGDAVVRQNSVLAYKTVYGEGKNFLYSKAGAGVTQQLTLKPGCYRLTAMLGSEGENTITLFAGDKEVTITTHPFGKHYLSEARIDDILVDESGELTIGVKGSSWFNADDFRLIYTGGNDTDAIEEISSVAKPAVKKGIYTLQGIQVDRISAPGIYIINGKKVIKR